MNTTNHEQVAWKAQQARAVAMRLVQALGRMSVDVEEEGPTLSAAELGTEHMAQIRAIYARLVDAIHAVEVEAVAYLVQEESGT